MVNWMGRGAHFISNAQCMKDFSPIISVLAVSQTGELHKLVLSLHEETQIEYSVFDDRSTITKGEYPLCLRIGALSCITSMP